MPPTSSSNRNLKLAACAVAFAAAMGGANAPAARERDTIDKLERYCTVSWRNAGIAPQEWDDCTQQALVELLDRISRAGLNEAVENDESLERRELNRTVWRTVQRWRRRPRLQPYEEAGTDRPQRGFHNHESESAWEQIDMLSKTCLSARQQRILSLMRDGWRVAEIADELQIPQARVSDEKYKAIVKLRGALGVA